MKKEETITKALMLISATCESSMSEVARRIGVTPQAVSLWLKGNRFPDYQNLVKLHGLAIETSSSAAFMISTVIDELYPQLKPNPKQVSNECKTKPNTQPEMML